MADFLPSGAAEARRQLGAELRAARVAAGRTTRQVDTYSTGHVSRVENGRVLPSRDLVAAYVAMGGPAGRLFSLLDRARVADRRRADLTAQRVSDEEIDLVEGLGDPHADPYLLRRGYTVELIESTYVMNAERAPDRHEHRVIIRTTLPGARYFPFRHAYDEDPRPGVSTVTAGAGCTLPVIEEGPSGTIYGVLDFAESRVDSTGAHKLEWTITMSSDVPMRPIVVGGTSAPVPHVVTAVQFTPPALPARVWWYRDFDTNAGTMRPTADRLLASHDNHRYRREWQNLDREWWGLAWTWPDKLGISAQDQ